MAVGTKSDFKIYDAQFWSGVGETMQQFAMAFGPASRNAIRLVSRTILGDFEKRSFLQAVSGGLVARRDVTSVDTVNDTKSSAEEFVSVKLSRRIGPHATTLDSLHRIGSDEREFSFLIGAEVATEVMVGYLNDSLVAADAAIAAVAALNHDGSAGTMTHGALNSGNAKLGDRAGRIVCYVMHSKVYHNLIGQAITDKITNVADLAIHEGSTPTLGRPVVVTDSASLYNPGTTDIYSTLGLVEDAVIITESDARRIVSEVVTGLANLVVRIQGEYSWNLGLKGYKYATGSGVNPTNAVIGTGSSWTKVASDNRNTAGIRITSQ